MNPDAQESQAVPVSYKTPIVLLNSQVLSVIHINTTHSSVNPRPSKQ